MASFQQRVIGAVRLSPATYEEVEHDVSATGQAAVLVVVASVTTSVAWYFGFSSLTWILRGAVQALIAWLVGAGALWLIGTKVLPGRNTEADLGQLLRTIGFAQAPGLFGVLVVVPLLGLFVPYVVALWVIAATVVAVRAALDYDSTLRAVVVCLLSWVVSAVVFALTGVMGTGVR